MKRILFLFSSMFLAGSLMAQIPDQGDLAGYKAKLEKSNKEIADANKASNPKTWIKRSELLEDIAEAPTKGIFPGMTKIEVQFSGGKPESIATVELNDSKYDKWTYYASALYLKNGIMSFSQVLHPVVEDPLLLSLQSLDEAVKADTKSSYTKKILERYIELNKKLGNTGSNYYAAKDMANAFRYYAAASDCASRPAVGNMDTIMTYYAGVTGLLVGKYAQAAEYFKKAHSTGYYGDHKDGMSFINLARCYENLKDKANVENTLLEGFQKFPANQGIILELINHYLTYGEDPSKVFPILKKAQGNEPTNASLFFAEGTLYERLSTNIKPQIAKVNEAINAKASENAKIKKQAETLYTEAENLRDEAAKLKRAKNTKASAEKLNLANAKSAESDKLNAKADSIITYDIAALNKEIDNINQAASDMQKQAEAAYLKAISLKPDYFDALYNLGAMYNNRGVAIMQSSTKVKLNDEAAIKKIQEDADACFTLALDPLNKAHLLNPTEKYTIETLKNIYFRFRTKSPDMMAKYKEYNTKLQSLK